MDLDLRDLRYFQVIAELGHLGRAAGQVGRSQPALTKCVDRLESTLGAELFERKGRGIVLTPVGEMLLVHARRLKNSADTTLREIRAFSRGEGGRVRIGCGPITADDLLPGICDMVLSRTPDLMLEITLGMNYILREKMRSEEIDLIVGLAPDGADEFVTIPLIDDTVVVVASKSHPIFAKRVVAMRDLLDYGWVLPIPAVASRQWLDRAFETKGLPLPRPQIEANSIPTLPQMIGRTDLLCFASRHILAKRNGAGLREVKLAATTLTRSLGITYPAERMPPAVKRLIDLLRSDRGWIGRDG